MALMAASGRLAAAAAAAGGVTPSTPPGMVPVYQKPAADKRRRRPPGAKPGHKGARRKPPASVDVKVEHRLDACPCCGGDLQRCDRTRTRLVEDVPQDLKPVVTEHTVHRDYCPNCKKHVEPAVPDAMPNATLGHHAVALSSYFHYGLGVSIAQARDLLGGHLRLEVTAGGLVSAWQRMADALAPWYEQAHRQLLATACLHADETGWRVDGADPLALVLLRPGDVPLPDRPQPRRAGPEAVLRRGVRGHPRHRLLGRVRRGRGRRPAGLPAPPVPRAREGRRAERLARVARVRQEAQAAAPRRPPPPQAARLHAGPVPVAGRPDRPAAGRPGRRRVRRPGRRPAGQAARAVPGLLLHVPGEAGRPAGQQPRRAADPAGRHPAEDDPVQPVGRRGRRAGGADERVPDAAAARARPDADDRGRAAGADLDRQTTAAAGASRCRRLKCYVPGLESVGGAHGGYSRSKRMGRGPLTSGVPSVRGSLAPES